MNSMTGHGRGVADAPGLSVTAEVTSVNKKSLEVHVQVPRAFEAAEAVLESQVRAAVSRGSVRVSVEVAGAAAEQSFSWDEAAVLASVERLRQLARLAGTEFTPGADTWLELAREHRTARASVSLEQVLPLFEKAVATALAELSAMRAREGASLKASVAAQVERLKGWIAEMQAPLSGVMAHHRDQLLKRLREAGLQLDVSDERVVKEVALFADRSDVSEELTRLASHFEQMGQFLAAKEPIGRKIEFLLQEMHREFNTLGSKSPSVAVTRLVMECKNELERLREQAANIE